MCDDIEVPNVNVYDGADFERRVVEERAHLVGLRKTVLEGFEP
jgi:predicted regulator of amino acid metabolism with ACT domain